MSKLRKHNNNKLILVLPIILVISFAVLLTYSFANFKSIKLFDAVGGFFLGNEYTLSYDVSNCTNKTIKNGRTFGELCTPAIPDGYTFDGWFYNGEEVTSDTNVRTNQNIQLLAHFSQNNTCIIGTSVDFDYTGDVQDYNANCVGTYKIELWGASGYNYNANVTNGGGYVSGNIEISDSTKLYIYVGEAGTLNTGGYNGGGSGRYKDNTGYNYGGGATDVRYFGNVTPTDADLEWDSSIGLNSRIMVAGGAGGSNLDNMSDAGGLTGYTFTPTNYTSNKATGGTQTAGGSVTNYGSEWTVGTKGYFGVGGIGGGESSNTSNGSGGGGGGYYGGAGASRASNATWGGGGGSSYISGFAGSIAIAEGSTSEPRAIKSGCSASSKTKECSTHYSGLYFDDAVMIDGRGCTWATGSAASCGTNQPQPNGTNAVGHSGNGYARITYLGYSRTYNYTGDYQTFTAELSGSYQVELWGGSGNNANAGYTKGVIDLTAGEKLYVFVGTSRNSSAGAKTFNAGTGNDGGHEGGGATDVRYFSTTPTAAELTWDNFDSLKARIMVAGGAGTGTTAGAGGGLIGYSGAGTVGGTQTAAGASQKSQYTASYFGIANGGCSGGNGYYPGGGATCANGAGGGSSFISGYSGCNAISETSTSSNIIHTGQSYHYSGKYFYDNVMIDGKGCNWSTGTAANCGAYQPQPDGTNAVGHSGNGYARITYLGVPVTVTFNANGGSVSENSRIAFKNNQIGTLPTPTYSNYVFDGWYLDSDYETAVDSTYVITGNITLYAKWTEGIELIPAMTSNTAPSGRVTSTNNRSEAYLYFDGDDTTCMDPGISVTGSSEAYISYAFPSEVLVKRIVIKNHTATNRISQLLRFEVSTNNSTWTTLLNLNGTTGDVDIDISNSTRYRYYRLILRGTTAYGPGICTMQLYGSK